MFDFKGNKLSFSTRYKKHPSQDFKPIVQKAAKKMRGDTSQYKSVDQEQRGTPVGPKYNKYTGTLVKGISCLHKSNAVPILNKEDIIDIARMRR